MLALRLPKKTEHALTMMVIIAQEGHGGAVSVRRMIELGLRMSYVVKAAKDLVEAHLIIAHEGRGGWNRLEMPVFGINI